MGNASQHLFVYANECLCERRIWTLFWNKSITYYPHNFTNITKEWVVGIDYETTTATFYSIFRKHKRKRAFHYSNSCDFFLFCVCSLLLDTKDWLSKESFFLFKRSKILPMYKVMTNYTREHYKTSLFNYIQFPLLSYHQCYKIRIHWNFHFYFFWQIMFSRYFQVVFYLLMNHFLGFYIKRFPSIHSFDKQKKTLVYCFISRYTIGKQKITSYES